MAKKKLGHAFKDEMSKVTIKNGHFKRPIEEQWSDVLLPNYNPSLRLGLENSFWRTTIFLAAIFIIFFILLTRLFHLQVATGEENRKLADGNRILIKVIHAPRGVIYDRNGQILAANSPGFRLIDPQTKKAIYLTRDEALEMEVRSDSRVNNLEVDSIRNYPQKEVAAHVLGYVGEVSPDQLKSLGNKYRVGDRIGQSGIEAEYEILLKGKDGGEIIEVDASGKKLRSLREVPPIPGKNLYLSIDANLQKKAYDQLLEATKKANSCCGALIAVDPSTGQVLALTSVPSFDNNIFTDQSKSDTIGDVLTRSDFPILNRAIGGTYPPGSTFKIVSSIAGLMSGKVTTQTQIEDTGRMFLGSYSFANWYFSEYGRTEGVVDIVKAIFSAKMVFSGGKILFKPPPKTAIVLPLLSKVVL
jgi:penicillin-binding protein 2